MKKILLLFSLVLFSNMVFGALWYNDPASCPNEHASYPGQSCGSTNEICGVSGGTIQCYDTDTLPNPPNDVNSNTSYSGSYNGGFLIDCFAYDGSSPFCDNSTVYWCDRDSTCYDKGRVTQCESGKWSGDAGDISCQYCRSPYIVCDGDHEDADGCEIYPGVTSCPLGTHNNINGSCDCVCDSGYFDCDASGPGAGDGCEVQTGTGCTTPYNTAGTWNECVCVGDKSFFETGTNTQYGTSSDENFFWGTMWGTNGWLAMLKNASTDYNFSVDVNANIHIEDSNVYANCFVWSDGTESCTAPTGGSGVGDGNFYSIPDFNNLFAKIVDMNTDRDKKAYITDVNGIFDEPMKLTLTSDWNDTYLNTGGISDGNFYSIPDFNLIYTKQVDINAEVIKKAYITDVNGADNLRTLISDQNNTGRLVWEAINLANAVLSDISYDTDFNLSYTRIGITPLSSLVYSTDFNLAYAKTDSSLSDFVFDLDFNNTYAKKTQDLMEFTLSSDFNNTYLNAGSGVDSNVFSAGIMNADTNAFEIDLNMSSNNIFNVNDMNVNGDLNVGGNLNVLGDLNVQGNLYIDQNIVAESILGRAMLIPDENRVCVGTETVFCFGLTCNETGDCNANFEFI